MRGPPADGRESNERRQGPVATGCTVLVPRVAVDVLRPRPGARGQPGRTEWGRVTAWMVTVIVVVITPARVVFTRGFHARAVVEVGVVCL